MKRFAAVAITLLAAASIFVLGQSCASPTGANVEHQRFRVSSTNILCVDLVVDTQTGHEYLVNETKGGFIQIK